MPCRYPLLATRSVRSDGKIKMRFIGSAFDTGRDIPEQAFIDGDVVRIPCGQCVQCRLEYSRQWAIRCVLESKLYPENHCWFLTLTYDNEHLQYNNFAVDLNTGECLYPTASLVPSDLTKFMKDLREYWSYHFGHTGIRFYACGEYGSLYKRPHFHIIVFNLPFPIGELKPYRYQKGDYPYFESDILSKIWKNGLLCVGHLSFDTCAYVARYMLKKQKGLDASLYYAQHGLTPEFTRMSRDPGIAREWFDTHKDSMYEFDSLNIQIGKGKYVPKPPAYFDRLYDVVDSERMQEVKKKRREMSLVNEKNRKSKSSLSEEEYAAQCEADISEKLLSLTRKL